MSVLDFSIPASSWPSDRMVPIYNLLINFKTFVYFSWGKRLMNILAITGRAFYIQQWCKSLLFSCLSPKTSEPCSHIEHKSSQKASLRKLASIIRFPDMSSFLLTGVTSILWTLEEDAESFCGFNICLLSLFGRIAALTLLSTRLSFIDSLFTFDKLIPVFTIFTTFFLTP